MRLILIAILAGWPMLSVAQDALDCSDPANQDDPTCLGLPELDQEITNFAPALAPLLAPAIFAGLAASTTTTSTTTTSTTGTTGQ